MVLVCLLLSAFVGLGVFILAKWRSKIEMADVTSQIEAIVRLTGDEACNKVRELIRNGTLTVTTKDTSSAGKTSDLGPVTRDFFEEFGSLRGEDFQFHWQAKKERLCKKDYYIVGIGDEAKTRYLVIPGNDAVFALDVEDSHLGDSLKLPTLWHAALFAAEVDCRSE